MFENLAGVVSTSSYIIHLHHTFIVHSGSKSTLLHYTCTIYSCTIFYTLIIEYSHCNKHDEDIIPPLYLYSTDWHHTGNLTDEGRYFIIVLKFSHLKKTSRTVIPPFCLTSVFFKLSVNSNVVTFFYLHKVIFLSSYFRKNVHSRLISICQK